MRHMASASAVLSRPGLPHDTGFAANTSGNVLGSSRGEDFLILIWIHPIVL